jgi:hypothetical protein
LRSNPPRGRVGYEEVATIAIHRLR